MKYLTLLALLVLGVPAAAQANPALVGLLSTGPIVDAMTWQQSRTDGQLHGGAFDGGGWYVGARWIKADGGTEVLGTDLVGLVRVNSAEDASVALGASLSLGGNFKFFAAYEAFNTDGTGWATGYSDRKNLIYGFQIGIPINGGALFSLGSN